MVDFELSSKQLLVAAAIAMGETHKQAAGKCGVTPGTVSKWMQDLRFKAKINEIQLNTLLEAQSKFRGLACTATKTLETILEKSKSEKMKLEAAKYILSTIQIAPSDGAFWMMGPTTAEEIESQEHVEAIQKRLRELQRASLL